MGVKIVNLLKFLGIQISANLKWEISVHQIVSRARQRLHFLQRLRSFGVSQALMVQFYRAVTESVLTFSFAVWYNGATAEDRNRLVRIVRGASRIVGRQLPTLDTLYRARVVKKAQSIMSDPDHPAYEQFVMLPSGRRLTTLTSGSKRTHDIFYPTAVRPINDTYFARFSVIGL